MTEAGKLPLVVLISGSGSNLQAIIDASRSGSPFEIRAVISNRCGVMGLTRAEQAGIPCRVLDHKDFPDRELYDRALIELIDSFQPRLVILAGFMRILTPGFVHHYSGHLLNIHPSLLPKFRGLHTHQRALDAGESQHGVSVHFVTEELDGGPLIAQAQVLVQPDDDAETLGARVLKREHQLYPQVIRWFAQDLLRLDDKGAVNFNGEKLQHPIIFGPTQAIT